MLADMKQISKWLIVPAIALALLGGLPVAAQAACLSGGEIQAAVSSGQILPLPEILSRAGIGGGSKVLQPVEVCDKGGQLYYQLSVLDKDGNARKLVLHALTGAS